MTTGLACSDGEFPYQDRCCKACPKGQYVQSPCQGSKLTVCQPCTHDYFIDETNFLFKCQTCRSCHSDSHMVLAGECKADQDRQCKCEEGYYCGGSSCDLCRPVTKCLRGYGVTTRSNGRTDTICELCPEGKYNNVIDSKTPCLTHTKCEALGLQMKTAGTQHSDAVCVERDQGCHWVLPAGLWAGLILTVLMIGFAYFFRRRKHRSKKKVSCQELPVNDIVLNLVNPIPVGCDQLCNGESHALCCSGEGRTLQYNGERHVLHCNGEGHALRSNGQQCDSDFPSTVMTTSCQVEVHHNMKTPDIECDGPGMLSLTPLEHVDQSAIRTGKMNNFIHSPCRSQPQEDEWSGT